MKHLNNRESESQFPAFPSNIMQGVAKEFVDLYSQIRETPEAFLWLSFVTYFGNAISPYVRLGCVSSEPRIYGVVIGKSGRTRKSAGINVARELFKRIAQEQVIVEGFGSAEGILVRLGTSANPQPAILHLDEISVIASKTDIKGTAGVAALHKLFEDHDYDHPLATKQGYTVRNAYLSLIGASTLEDFTKAWAGKHEDVGFFSRLLLVASDTDKRISLPLDPAPQLLEVLLQRVQSLLSSVIGRAKTINVDDDAAQIWDQFYSAFGDGPEWNRIDAYGFRLMVVQAILRQEKSITKENVQQVIDFLQYEVAVRRMVAPVIAETPAAKMEELIRRHLQEGETVTRRDLQRRTNYTRYGIDVFERAVTSMKKNGELAEREDGRTTLYTRSKSGESECERAVEPAETPNLSETSDQAAAFNSPSDQYGVDLRPVES